MRFTWLAVVWLVGACAGREAIDDGGTAADAPLAELIDARIDARVDGGAGGPDACIPGCHWDCFGGSQCVAGVAWVNLYAPVSCCTFSDPWPHAGPVCGLSSHPCEGGTCATPDPRYAGCLWLLGSASEWCTGATCEHLLLYCPEGAAKRSGDPCDDDRDCRPAAEGVARLRCDVSAHRCVVEARPPAPADYGASCGLTLVDVAYDGERLVSSTSASCPLCQVYRDGACLRQGCSMACTFDEDCPAGSICLCAESRGGPVSSYCAAATDRTTDEGRAAGLPACP